MRALIAALMMCYSGVASAQSFYTGNDLHEFCKSKDPIDRGILMGFSVGVLNTAALSLKLQGPDHKLLSLCAPTNITVGQVQDVVCQFLEKTPQVRNQSGQSLVWVATAEAWPCK